MSEAVEGVCWVILVAILCGMVLCCVGCMAQRQQSPTATVTLPSVPKGCSSYNVIIVGAQLAAKPVDLGGIISPKVDANAAASQNGNPVATTTVTEPITNE